MKRLIKASMLLMVAALFVACANEDITQDKKKENGTEAPKGGVVFATNDTKISAKRRFIDEDEFAGAKTRTNIKHTPGNGADAYWTSDDFIWVKDKNGTWQKSTGTTLHDGGASAEFTLPGNKTDYADGCEVRYTGIGQAYYRNSPSYSTIGIPDNQSRTAANDFSHAVEWGDCGSGKAYNTGNPDKFNFSLSHKSAYLCFLPRCTNGALAPNIRLKGIKINAERQYTTTGFFANYSDFDGEDIHNTDGTPFGGNIITVTLPDFPLYTTENQAANATYLVVRPGTYDFKIEYTIKDPTTNVSISTTQTLTNVTLKKGEINDITYNIARQNLDTKFYMWDAKQHFWWGHLKSDGTPDDPYNNYPKNNTDPRWYHEGVGPFAATESCKGCPNVNEMCWYVKRGDPHLDFINFVIAENGHLHTLFNTRGIWLKKKSAILRDNPDVSEHRFSSSFPDKNGTDRDWRTETDPSLFRTPIVSVISGGTVNLDDYFFLPAFGFYNSFGALVWKDEFCRYWTSSAAPGNWVYHLSTSDLTDASPVLYAAYDHRSCGQQAYAFE